MADVRRDFATWSSGLEAVIIRLDLLQVASSCHVKGPSLWECMINENDGKSVVDVSQEKMC